ncbi:SAM-dependent methyltransferase [Nocardia wallacei]|uniref:SAM-dependent methyltransferase n=1 Tax=Nocardia wallacei TaxID=480035 RepID=UPI002453C475|nr:SAM-dependent methyltransferase [Nocardia wallacei]
MSDDRAPVIRTDIPHSARIWNYWMGGKDNYEIDRAVGDASIEIYPDITFMAQQSRQFLIRAVQYVAAECGVRQFLDIGTGLPTMQNTHEVAQSVAPDAKIVYVDNDPLVLVHAEALLTNTTDEGVTTYIDADFNEPEAIIAAATNILNFSQPVAVMFMGVLGHVQTYEHARRVVDTVMDAVPSGSFLILYDGTTDDQGYVDLCAEYTKSGGVPYHPRTREQVKRYFDGLEMVEPGFVSITQWRSNATEVGSVREIGAYCAVARKQ